VAAREAGKQSRRRWLPAVDEAAATAEVAARLAGAARGVVLDAQAGEPLSALGLPATGDVLLVVGPEGGIADTELAAFADAGAVVRRLGPTVLRASTAAAVAAGVVLSRTWRWR
jgi:16S rRNA (uracil1498-N3)-methyltransferase